MRTVRRLYFYAISLISLEECAFQDLPVVLPIYQKSSDWLFRQACLTHTVNKALFRGLVFERDVLGIIFH